MPDTQIVKVSGEHPSGDVLDVAAEVLEEGGLVAFPTETVYGLGADAFNGEAIHRIFAAKGRPSDNPLIVHLSHVDQTADVATEIPAVAFALAKAFWPGPLTMVLKGNGKLPFEVTAKLETVAVRVPDHAVPRGIIERLGRGIVGPSANASGHPSPTTAEHVYKDLQGRIEMIVDAGPAAIGVESTVVDVTVVPPVILRPGRITREDLEEIVGAIGTTHNEEGLRRSPGTRHRHYAPQAEVELFAPGEQNAFDLRRRALLDSGRSIGVVVWKFHVEAIGQVRLRRIEGSAESYAHQLYGLLRELDEAKVEVILIEEPAESGIGIAVVDRIRKAAHSGNRQ